MKRILYEPEDDVLNIWLSKKHYDYAEDENGVIIHYTKDREPVYVEILEASRFFSKGTKKDISYKTTTGAVAIPHRIR